MANWYVCKAVLVASMGALLTGLFTGSVNGLFEMNGFQNSFPKLFTSSDNCSTSDLHCGRCSSTKSCSGGTGSSANSILGLMASIGNLGAMIGALLGGWYSTKLGRKMSLVVGGGHIVVGAALSGFAFYSWFLIIGRTISGIGVGIIYVVMPVYISEISPKKSRGLLTSSIGPIFGLGLLISISLNCVFTKFCLGWRMPMVMQVVVGLTYLIGMLFLPRTPRWLVLNKRNGEAHFVLSRINGFSLNKCIDTCLELEDLKETTNTFLSQNYFIKFAREMKQMLQWKYNQRFLLSFLLFMVTGPIGNFTYYFGATFFCNLNIPGCFPNIIVSVFLLIGGVITFIFIDLVGRKLLLLLSTPILILLLILVTSLSQVFSLENGNNKVVGYVIVTLFCLYALIYSISWVIIPWVITSEIFPVEARGTKIALTTATFWLCSFLATQFVPLIINSVLGVTGFFYILIGINVFSFMIPLLGLPETKGVSLEEMDVLFDKPWLQRTNLIYYLSCGISKEYKRTWENEAKDIKDAMESKQKEVL